jgi:CheY-like chemotaxis protein
MEQVHAERDDNFPGLLTPEPHSVTEAKSETKSETKSGKQSLGYGLALVSRIVRNMNGQLRLKSEEGKGSRFVIQFGFVLPETAQKKPESVEGTSGIAASSTSPNPATPPITEGEVMLVSKSASKPKRPSAELVQSRRTSQESIGSARSGKSLGSYKSGSSQRSDVDRLIDAISEPHMLERSGSTKSSKLRGPPSTRSIRPTPTRSRTAEAAVATLGRDESELQPSGVKVPGQADVQDQKTPIRPIRMPHEAQEVGSPTRAAPPRPRASFAPAPQPLSRAATLSADHLSALVAEDDLVNSKIMQKRLQKVGHTVYLTMNGEECATAFGDNRTAFAVVFMDMQVSDLRVIVPVNEQS